MCPTFGRSGLPPAGATALAAGSGASKLAEEEHPDEGLRVPAVGDRPVELRQRPGDDLQALLLLLGLGTRVVEVGGEVDDDLLLGEPRARVEALELTPFRGTLADFLGQFAL